MATVRFSNELRHNITSKANALFTNRINAMSADVVPEDIFQRVIEPAYSKIIEDARRMPPAFVNYTKEVSVLLVVASSMYRRDYVLSYEVPVPKERVAIKDGVSADNNWRNLHFRVTKDVIPEDMWEGILEKARAIAALREEHNTFTSNLDKLINHYATLAPALKEWPPLWDLLPDNAKAKHKEITEKRKRTTAKEELDLSLDKMTGTVVASKIAGKL